MPTTPALSPLMLALSLVLVGQFADDALIAVPAAIAAVCLGHMAEKPEAFAIAIWKRLGLFVGSVCLAVVAGYLSRQNAETAKATPWVVVVSAMFAQDTFMLVAARKQKLFARLNKPRRPRHP